jgi:hypothetical protein
MYFIVIRAAIDVDLCMYMHISQIAQLDSAWWKHF